MLISTVLEMENAKKFIKAVVACGVDEFGCRVRLKQVSEARFHF